MKFFMQKIIFLFFFYSFNASAQHSYKDVQSEVLELYKRVNSIYGNVYIDTSCAKSETSELKYRISKEDYENINRIISSNNMKAIDKRYYCSYSFGSSRVISKEDFYKLRDNIIEYSHYEVSYNNKLDSLIQEMSVLSLRTDSLAVNNLNNSRLVLKSSYWRLDSEKRERSRKKIFNINSVFESEKYILIVYSISELHSILHTKTYFDFILK